MAEKAARDSLVDHFVRFTQSKNVMGLPQDPNGKTQKAGSKTRFNVDDGLSFKSDLTYHDFSFNTTETEKNDKGQEVSKRLFAFVSPHGKISGAGGSSILERTAFALDQKFDKEDRDEKNQKKIEEAEKQGVSFRSIFKIETQEIVDDKNGGQDAKNGNKAGGGAGAGGAAQGAKNAADEAKNAKAEKIKVERIFMRDEAKPEIEKVGEDSFEDIRANARDKGFEGDDKTLPNGVLLRFAAGAATQALWNSTLANLSQRRATKGLRSG